MKEERIRELEGKIVAICVSGCAHAKFSGGWWTCDRKRSQCHSGRVRRWLDEIKRLEEANEQNV